MRFVAEIDGVVGGAREAGMLLFKCVVDENRCVVVRFTASCVPLAFN